MNYLSLDLDRDLERDLELELDRLELLLDFLFRDFFSRRLSFFSAFLPSIILNFDL